MIDLLIIGSMALLMLGMAGLVFSLTGVAIAFSIRHAQRRWAAWRQATETLAGRGRVGDTTATVDGLDVRIVERKGSGDDGSFFTDVDVSGPSDRIHIEPHCMLSGLFEGVDHEVGDPSVDDRFVLGGHPLALGLLDAQTRHVLRRVPFRLSVSDGLLRLRVRGQVTDATTLEGMVRWAAAITKGLVATDAELADRLVQGVLHDPEVRVQQRFLEVLREHAPDHARNAAQQVADHPQPALRVAAASTLGDVERLVVVVGDEEAEEQVRIQAMQALAGTPEVVRGVARAAAAPDAPGLWHAAAQVAAKQGGGPELAEALVRLEPHMHPSRWTDVREARARRVGAARELAKALGVVPRSDATEALLLTLLNHDDHHTRGSAIDALGQVGSIAAVAALQEAGTGRSSRLATSTQDAVRAIQARAGGARGGLSIATGSGGDLAVAERSKRSQRATRLTERPLRG